MSLPSPEGGPRAVVIWNAGAGSTSQADEIHETLLQRRDIQLVETGSREDAIREVEQACRSGMERVIAAGGDGTVNAVVTALTNWHGEHGSSPALAVLPLGTGNDLARSLGMPLVPAEALELCLSGAPSPMDVMQLETDDGDVRLAGNMVTAGNTGKYLEVLTDDLKQRWGALVYVRGAVDLLEDLDVFRVRVEIDEEPAVEVDALNLFFANGRTSGGGMTVCADAALDDGKLMLLIIREGTGLDLASLTLDYLTSDVRENDLVDHRRCQRVRVTCPEWIPLTADGDPVKSREFTVILKPAAIRTVMVRT